MALKKPKNTGALNRNYKGFFAILMLALIDGQYKFRWVDAGTAGSCSDAQIFNASQLKRRIEDGRIGFPDPAPIIQGGRDVPYFILADDAFALKTWLMKPYGRRMLTREERIANYRISRGRRVVENAFCILASRFRVMRTTIELPPETVREVVFTCVVLHNILRSQHQGQHGGQKPGEDDDDDVPGDCGLIGGAAGGGPERNPAREAKRQRVTSRTTSIMREQWPGKMAEYKSCCSKQSFPGLTNSPFQDYQIFQNNQLCLLQTNPLPNITYTDGHTDKPHAKHNLFRRTNRQTPCKT